MTWININKHVIASNHRTGENQPPIRVAKTKSGAAKYAHEVLIEGPCRILYDPEGILHCGAKVAIYTEADVKLDPTSGRVRKKSTR